MSWFSRKNRDKEEVLRDKESLDRGLEKTKRGLFDRLSRAVAGKSKVDDDVLDAIEDALIASDVGVDTTLKIIDMLEDPQGGNGVAAGCGGKGGCPGVRFFQETLCDNGGRRQRSRQDYNYRKAGGKSQGIRQEGHAGSGRYLPRRGRRPAGDLEREGGSSHSEAEHGC